MPKTEFNFSLGNQLANNLVQAGQMGAWKAPLIKRQRQTNQKVREAPKSIIAADVTAKQRAINRDGDRLSKDEEETICADA